MALVSLYQTLLDLHSWIPYRLAVPLRGWALPMAKIQLEVTSRCNLKCGMCIFVEPNMVNTRQKMLEVAEYRKVIGDLPWYTLITFTGGEPFMRPEFIEILQLATRRHRSHIITNGMFINEEKARRLVELGAQHALGRGLLLVGVSIHGERDTHNEIVGSGKAFDMAVEGIGRLNEARTRAGKKYPQVNIQCVIQSRNYTQLRSMVELAAKLEVPIVNFISESEFNYTYDREIHDNDPAESARDIGFHKLSGEILSKSLHDALDLAKRLGITVRLSPWRTTVSQLARFYDGGLDLSRYNCIDPWSTVVLSPFGEVSHCLNMHFGNVRDKKISKLFNGKRFREFRLDLKKARLFRECEGCCWMRFDGAESPGSASQPVESVWSEASSSQQPSRAAGK